MTERAQLLADLQAIPPEVTEPELRALLERAETWMGAHPDDLEVAGTSDLASRILAAMDAGLIAG